MDVGGHGAQFVRASLQVNPYGYIERTGGSTPYESEQDYNEAMVEAMTRNGISLIGVTDHFAVGSGEGLRRAAAAADITVLPGFEAHTKDGVHFLVLFDPATESAEIDRCIGACGVRDVATELSPGDKDCLELLDLARQWGAVAVAAHATNAKGVLKELSGQPRANVWRSPDLLAAAIPGSIDDLPPAYRSIVGNADPAHRRVHPLAILNARDVSDPADFEEPGAWTWLKLTTPSIDSVRQAFLDPGSRIRLQSQPDPAQHTELTAISWDGGFLDGVRIPLNECLNVLIGGRGSGKSTIVESIRFVFGLEPLGAEARQAHEGFVKSVLKPGTRVTIDVRSPTPSDRRYRLERSVGARAAVRSEAGDLLELAPGDVIPDLEVLGQHEIAELARLPEERARLLRRFVPDDPSEEEEISTAARELRRNAREILKAADELESSGEALEALPALEERMARFEELGLGDRLEAQSELAVEEALHDEASSAVGGIDGLLEQFATEAVVDLAFLEEIASDAPEDLHALRRSLETLQRAVAEGVAGIREAIVRAGTELEEARGAWQQRTEPTRAAYEGVLRTLQNEGIDAGAYLDTQRRIARLRPTERDFAKQEAKHRSLVSERRELLAGLEDLRTSQFRRIERAAKSVSRRLRPNIRISVHYQGGRSALHAFLADNIGGRLDTVRRELDQLPALSLPELASACRDGADALVAAFGFAKKQALALAAASESVLLELEELEIPTTASIELNVASADGDPVWRDLDELSTGQRATAVLMLLLYGGDSPLVIDQPEDDLDNAFISEGVVPRLREAKLDRQFILTSHNPNIPVLADAELIAVLAAEGDADGAGSSMVETIGSIDSDAVRSVVELLEGGRVAFDQRRRRYGF